MPDIAATLAALGRITSGIDGVHASQGRHGVLTVVYAVAKLVLQKIAAGFWEQKCTGLQTLIWSLAKLLDLLAGASSGVHLALLCGKESWTAAVGLVYWVALHFIGRKLTDAPALPPKVVEQQAQLMSKVEKWKALDAERQAKAAEAKAAAPEETLVFCGSGFFGVQVRAPSLPAAGART